MHFQLIDIVRHSLVLPGANLESIVSLEIDAANTCLSEDYSEWELVGIVEGNQSHGYAISFPRGHVELDDSIRLFSIDRVDFAIVPGHNSEAFSFKVDHTPDVMPNKIPLCSEDKFDLLVIG